MPDKPDNHLLAAFPAAEFRRLDRLPSNKVVITHELVAGILGVRRESVTAAAGKLQRAGVLSYRRGHIAVVGRPRLEAAACECYTVVRQQYSRLRA